MKNWADGTSDSPHVAGMMSLLKNVEIDSFAGAVRGGKKPETAFHTAYSSTFTANTNDTCTSTATVPNTATCVQLTTSGTLPAGLSLATNYFIIKLSSTTFKLATTIALANAGMVVAITDTGTGTHTVATVDPGTAWHIVRDPRTGTKFLIDSNGVVWYSEGSLYLVLSTNTAKTNAAGNGLTIFRVSDGSATYLFAFRNKAIDVINVYGDSNKQTPVWVYGWNPSTGGSGATVMNTDAGTANSHHAIVGQDNIIYYTDDRYIGSIAEIAGQVFAPGTTSTYTYSSQALDLPLGSLAYWLEQLGVNIIISVSNDSFLYPWDRSSDSYGLPIPIGEWGGNKMKNIGNVVYVLAGSKGNIYWTQGTYCRLFKYLPTYLTSNVTTVTSSIVTWGGIAAAGGKLLVGVGANSGQSGVYMATPDGKVTIDNYPSTGQANVTAIYADNDFYDMGYAGGADNNSYSQRYTSCECIIQSELFRVGDKTTKATLSTAEVQIATGLSGNVRIGYRTNTTGAFTTIATFTTAGGTTSYEQDIGLTNLENVQFQVEYGNGLDLLEVNFYE